MEHTFLRDFIKHISPVSEKIAAEIACNFEQVSVQKNDFILKEGKVSDRYVVIEKGLVRAYTDDADGNEVTTGFFGQRSVVFEVASFFRRTPAKENIRALTDCEGWQLSFETLNMLFHAMPEFREFGRTVLVNGFVTLKERMLSVIHYSAEQRYEQLLRESPEILQHAPLKNIASFLGITDTSLSRIRKEMMHK